MTGRGPFGRMRTDDKSQTVVLGEGHISELVKAISAKYTLEDLEYKNSPKHTAGKKIQQCDKLF